MDNQPPIHRPIAGPTYNLTRYGSAPTSLLTSLVDSVNGSGGPEPVTTLPMSRFFNNNNSYSTSSEHSNATASSGNRASVPVGPTYNHQVGEFMGVGEDRKKEGGGGGLLRHSSSPAGFFSNLLVDNNAYTVSRGIGHYSQPSNNGTQPMPSTRLKSQLSFSRQEPLSQISEVSIPEMGESIVGDGNSSDEAAGNQSYISSNFSFGSWDETNSIAFASPSNKRRRDNNDDLLASLGHLDSQYSLPTTSLEMATIDKLFQAQQDSVAFKVRAKRGCATHPRSIAERERRTRISEKLRKLQDLVPNMDKQTSTSDMLDLAVQHIKELQNHIQELNQDRAHCTCACKEEIP